MPVLPGAEPYSHDGQPIGIVLCHGFTSTPQSLRPWAEYLSAADLSVRLPLLPGHGRTWADLGRTTWRDWYGEIERAFLDLCKRCNHVFAMGLSMGAALALRLAEMHGDAVSGLVVVNPSVLLVRHQAVGIVALRPFVRSLPGIGSNIRKPGVSELAYDRIAPSAAASLRRLHRTVRADLSAVVQPMLIYRSAVDRVVPASSTTYVVRNVRSSDLDEIVLPNSFHVAPLDHDADQIFAGSLTFVRRIAGLVED